MRAAPIVTDRLRDRRGEIEEAVIARVSSIADPGEVSDTTYAEGLRAAISQAIEYGLEALEANEERPPPVPVSLIAQARLAARNRIGIDTVLRRYLAGFTLLGNFLTQEAAELNLSSVALKHLLRAHANAFEQLVATIGEEHAREAHATPDSTQQHRLRLVRQLLAGELVDSLELRYNLNGSHVGFAGAGPGVEEVVRGLASASDCLALVVCPGRHRVWGWLGGPRSLDSDQLLKLAKAAASTEMAIGIGEPADGTGGWRLTHNQAEAALPIALRRKEPALRYGDVALLAAALQDQVLSMSLRQLYLHPLKRGRVGNKLLETLRAYFAAGHNVSSAAAALGVNRATVASRLRLVEERVGRQVDSSAVELQVALEFDSCPGEPLGFASNEP